MTTTSGWIRRPNGRTETPDEKRPRLPLRTSAPVVSPPSRDSDGSPRTPKRAPACLSPTAQVRAHPTPHRTSQRTPTQLAPISKAPADTKAATPRKRERSPEPSPEPWHDFDEQAYRQLAGMSPCASSARIRRGPDGFRKVEQVWRDSLPPVQKVQTSLQMHGFSVPIPRTDSAGGAWLRRLEKKAD